MPSQASGAVFRTVKNATGSALAKGKIVVISAAPTDKGEVELADAATDVFYGVVANADIPDGSYGDVQVLGIAPVLAGGTVAAGARVTADASGDGVAASTGNSVLGVAVTAGADTYLFEVDLAGPGGGAMP